MAQQGDDESRKQQIRAAAVRCFVRRGFSATRLLDIARAAGLSKGGVYFYYNTKDALFEDVLEAQRARLEQRWSQAPSSDEAVEASLRRLIIAHLGGIEDDPEDTRLSHLLISMASQEGSFRDKLDAGQRVLRSLYATVIGRGVRTAIFRDGQPDQLADLVLAMIQGLAAQTALDPQGRLRLRPGAVADAVLGMLRSPVESVARGATRASIPQRPALQS